MVEKQKTLISLPLLGTKRTKSVEADVSFELATKPYRLPTISTRSCAGSEVKRWTPKTKQKCTHQGQDFDVGRSKELQVSDRLDSL